MKPYSGDPKLVIAFDVGTTFSGISYCILERNQVPEILGVTRFPGQAKVNAKVPSLLYYDSSGNVKAAGAEVLTEDVIEEALNEGWIRAEWWKLHLRPKHLASSINKNDDLPPLPPGKTAVHVLTDFIRYLFLCARTYIEERHLAFSWSSIENSIEYIFTHPNGGEGVQQQLYRRAIEFAGLVPSTPEGRSRVHMLTEGEASLHFCVANLINVDLANQATPQGVVIIDAGGRTVDLSMFSMTSNPISCEEMAPAECRLQGSVFVTRRARVLLEKKLQGWEHSSPDEIAEYTREFDQSTKLVIKSDQEPAYLRVGGRRTNVPKYNISFGKLKLTGEEATGLFNESFDAIISAFEQQQKAAETQITMGFFVGGLSTNDWIWSRLQAYFEDKKIKVCRPDNHINKAVANGAVLSHVDRENHKVTSRVARATYGVVCAVPVKPSDEEHMRRKHRWETDPTGERFVPGFFEAKLLKGDKVGEDMDFRESFSLTESDPAQFTTQAVRLECYRGNIRHPTWVDQDPLLFFTFCTIFADLSKAANDLTMKKKPSGEIFYQLDYDVIVYFGLTELEAFLGWKTMDGECKIPAEVKFHFEDNDRKDENQSRQPRKRHQVREYEAQFDNGLDCITALVRQITTPRGNNDSGRDSTSVPSKNKEIRQRLDTLSMELDSARRELEVKEDTIASLLAEVGLLKQCNAGTMTTQLSVDAFRRWVSEGSIYADKLVLDGVLSLSSDDVPNVLIRSALVGARSQNWNAAYQDAKKSVNIRGSAMGYIAQAFILAGKGELEEAMKIFDLAFHYCHVGENRLLLLVKAMVLCVAEKYDDAISRIHGLMDVSRDEETIYSCIQVLGKIYLMQGDYQRAIETLEQTRSLASSCTGCHLETITMIFGWTFDRLQVTVQLQRCTALLAAGRVGDVAEELLKVFDTFAEEMSPATITWVTDLKNKCLDKLDALGDEALRSGKHDEAIMRYSSALSLRPSNRIHVLVKRTQARAAKGLWEDALADADEVIKLDPWSHEGYERKSMAFYGGKNYAEATNALLRMLSIIENSPDEEIRRIGENYISPLEATRTIDTAVQEIFRLCPLVLIDLDTGKLWNEHERIQVFRSDVVFKKLVAEVAITKLDYPRVRRAVADYFKWVMFSHTWEGKEPTFQDVNVIESVWKLDSSPLNEKLRQFCTTSCEDGHRWAWSDTCCIDKSTSAVLSQSITSMYRWYEEAAETLVYLADVLSSAKPGALTKSRWMTRAWTLQELLASKVVRFYTRDWKLYLDDSHHNHKESPLIKQELARAIGVVPETLDSFHPDDLGVREKLRLASNRHATREEDIAYSLIGIFSSDIRPQYGLGKTALGELLENVVARTGDVTVMAWTGKSLAFNSALPDSLAVYRRTPRSPPPIEADELDGRVDQLRSRTETQGDVLAFYDQVVQLPRATFSHRCLQLPCIGFPVVKLGVQNLGGVQGTLYCALVSILGRVEFRTADAMPLEKPRKLILIHPWFRDLCPHLDEFASDDEMEMESKDVPDGGVDSGIDDSDDSAPVTPLHAKPLTRVDRREEALRLLACLGSPFNALLLMRQQNGRYKRVATEYEIIVSGVPQQANPKDLRAKVLEII